MADLKKLAEQLTSLTVLEVNDLKNILKEEYGIELQSWENITDIDACILAVAHQKYVELDKSQLKEKINHRGLIMDVKSLLDPDEFEKSGIMYWRL